MIAETIAMINASEEDVSGMAMSTMLRDALARMTKQSGDKVYPELAWGSKPGIINGLPVAVNSTVGKTITRDGSEVPTDLGIVGDFASGFKWGYAKEIPMEIIQYGDPDNSKRDLKGHNEIYIRCEMYLGWGILIPSAFARILAE